MNAQTPDPVGSPAETMTEWPLQIRHLLIDRHVSPGWLPIGFREASGFKRAVCAGESKPLLRQEIEGSRRLDTAFARSVRRGDIRQIAAGHVTMHLGHPEAAMQAIRDLLGLQPVTESA
jgi:hypothetical protein